MGGGQSVGKKRTIGGFGVGGSGDKRGKSIFGGKFKKDGVGRKFRSDLQLSYYTSNHLDVRIHLYISGCRYAASSSIYKN